MAKNLKLTIKNAQIAEAVNLSGLKEKLASKKAGTSKSTETPEKETPAKATAKAKAERSSTDVAKEEAAPKVRARSRSAFAETSPGETKAAEPETLIQENPISEPEEEFLSRQKSSEELRKEIFAEELATQQQEAEEAAAKDIFIEEVIEEVLEAAPTPSPEPLPAEKPAPQPPKAHKTPHARRPQQNILSLKPQAQRPMEFSPPPQRLGPTGRHISDLMPPPKPASKKEEPKAASAKEKTEPRTEKRETTAAPKGKTKGGVDPDLSTDDSADKKGNKKFKEFKDIKPLKKGGDQSRFDGRDRQGLRDDDDESSHWRKRRGAKARPVQEDTTIRPTSLHVRIPIALKDLAAEMKLKASQLIAKLFAQGVIITLNDLLEDETTIQLLGHEFGCEITIDTSEEQRLRITDKTIKEEIKEANPDHLQIRPPVVTFMGHVDHGKTSLIDAIRKSNRASGEAGAITQHIGAFLCSTPVGDISVLDTPGHEAFSAMRARGADVTDIVVLVVAGDEGMRQQTIEALNHAKAAGVTIVVALNKCDKPNFNAETVYRQLAEQELLPESWGGQTITVNCSAVTGEGIQQLLEMLALQAEILELKADPTARARGSVLESELHKGMGAIATVLVQNGTLRCGDPVVFGGFWGRVKTMRNEYGKELQEAGPSTPVEITGMSGLPTAGEEFIVVKTEKEAREIAEARQQGMRQINLLQTKKLSMDNLMLQAADSNKKILNIVLRADVQGSLEALKAALMKISSTKADLNIISAGVGEISESDVNLAAASKAVIVGFHTQIESHADALIKQSGIQVRSHDIIYHAIDDVKAMMAGLLDKIAQETEKGKIEVKALFKSSQLGIIAGGLVTEGTVHRNHQIRVRRGKEVVWKGGILSLKRVKEDVREVTKGLECGVVLNGFSAIQEGDILEAYEVTYISQEL